MCRKHQNEGSLSKKWISWTDGPVYMAVILTHCGLMMPICRQRNWSILVQIMACRLFGAKPLLEAMLAHCQTFRNNHSEIWLELWNHFRLRKCIVNVVCKLFKLILPSDVIYMFLIVLVRRNKSNIILRSLTYFRFNSLRPSDAYMSRQSKHHWFR